MPHSQIQNVGTCIIRAYIRTFIQCTPIEKNTCQNFYHAEAESYGKTLKREVNQTGSSMFANLLLLSYSVKLNIMKPLTFLQF